MRGVAGGDVKFVGGDDAQSRVPIFPPELMTDSDDFDCFGGLGACWIDE